MITDTLEALTTLLQTEKSIKVNTSFLIALLKPILESSINISDEIHASLIEILQKNHAWYLPELPSEAGYWDVSYITPAGSMGTHVAVRALDVSDVVRRTPIMLSYGTSWHPSMFTVVSVAPTLHENMPMNPPMDTVTEV